MSVEIACTCGGLPPHSHVFRHDVVAVPGGRRAVPVDTGEIRIWVDWKAVARELAVPSPRGSGRHACEKAGRDRCLPCKRGFCPNCVAQRTPEHDLCEA